MYNNSPELLEKTSNTKPMKKTIISIIISLNFTVNILSQDIITDINKEITEGNLNKAIELAKQNAKQNTKQISAWQLLADVYELSDKHFDAISALNTAIKIDSTNISAKLDLAKLYNKIGNKTRAIKEYENIIKIKGDNISALLNLSHLYLEFKKYKKAYNTFSFLHQLDTTNSEFVRLQGVCKYKQSEILEALKYFKLSYKINNKNLKSIYWLVDIYISAEKDYLDTAEVIVNNALKDYPNNGKLYEKRGNINFRRNHHYRAIPDYQKAIELEYAPYKMKVKLAKSLFATKKYEESKEILENLIVKDTLDYQVCMYLGGINNELKEYKKSLLFYNKAIEILEPSPDVLVAIFRGISENYRNQKQYHKQITYIKKRHNVKGNRFAYYEYLLEIAEIYDKNLKDYKNSLIYYEKYWNIIKDSKWRRDEYKEKILSKINRLKEEIHFQKVK